MNVLCYPQDVLRQRAEPVTEFDDQLAQTARDMIQTMAEAHGVGLAAPQVGLSVRLVVINWSGEAGGDLVLVNPEIIAHDGRVTGDEGCLSFPGIFIKVQRYATVTVRYQDLDGHEQTIEADGLLSRALQHEIDHLDGVLLVDRMTPVQRLANRRALKMLEVRRGGRSDAVIG